MISVHFNKLIVTSEVSSAGNNPEVIDASCIAVSLEDERSFCRDHKRADRIIEHAKDISLIGSYRYKKKTFHLVRHLEPVVIIGRRILELQNAYHYTLLKSKLENEKVNKCRQEKLML